ncbi:hypothetical protein M3182_05930 [Mesobacillus maritimus]|uniref:hypothetical protein n=1 Tax=Mesobacillus maritimus TaxID=1643336 RepID=UPI00204075AA|nr:hypothetical protein [Mesobacillus maritimus]MCM3585281.1 hypothetical protein [Mesobacillus maritimus]
MLDVVYGVIFVVAVYYIVSYQLNLKKAAEIAHQAIYPKLKEEFDNILIPAEWKAMQPLSKTENSYLYVKWGTAAVLFLATVLMGIILFTDWLSSSFFNVIYFLFVMIQAIPHRGNLFIFPNGVIMNAKYYSSKQIESYKVEQIIRWHELYGLDDRVNNGYKLTFRFKKFNFFQNNFVVVPDRQQLERLIGLLNDQGITGSAVPVNGDGNEKETYQFKG